MKEKKSPTVSDIMKKAKKISFLNVLEMTVQICIKKPLHLIGIALFPYLIIAILESYIYPGIIKSMIVGGPFSIVLGVLVLLAISVAIYLLISGMLIRTVDLIDKNEKLLIAKILQYVKENFINALKLAVEIIKYTKLWIMIAYFGIITVLAIAILYVGQSAVAPFLGLYGILVSLAPIAIIVYIIIYFRHIIHSSFAWFIFFSSEKPSVNHSMNRSLEIAKDMTWAIFVNYVLVFALGALFSWILSLILIPFLAPIGWAHSYYFTYGSVTVLGALIYAIVCPFTIAFIYKLKQQVEKMKHI